MEKPTKPQEPKYIYFTFVEIKLNGDMSLQDVIDKVDGRMDYSNVEFHRDYEGNSSFSFYVPDDICFENYDKACEQYQTDMKKYEMELEAYNKFLEDQEREEYERLKKKYGGSNDE